MKVLAGVCVVLLCSASLVLGDGAIAWSGVRDIIVRTTGAEVVAGLDLDERGTSEILVVGAFAVAGGSGTAVNSLRLVRSGAPAPALAYVGQDARPDRLGGAVAVGASSVLCEDEPGWVYQGAVASWKPGETGYMGIRFTDEATQVHYGWVLLSVAADGRSATIHEWAYNLAPGAPIETGQGGLEAAFVSETLNVRIDKAGGETTRHEFVGKITLEISGLVFPVSAEPWGEDAFYRVSCEDGSNLGRALWGLHYSLEGCACQTECGGTSVGDAAPGSYPSFHRSNDYTVILDVGSEPTHVTLGTGDCGTIDNIGRYRITVTGRATE